MNQTREGIRLVDELVSHAEDSNSLDVVITVLLDGFRPLMAQSGHAASPGSILCKYVIPVFDDCVARKAALGIVVLRRFIV